MLKLILGGVIVSFHDTNRAFGAIKVFTSFPQLNSILKKVRTSSESSLTTIISSRAAYKLSERALEERPEISSIQASGAIKTVGTNAFTKLDNIVFFAEKPSDGHEYVQFLGLIKNNRYWRWGRMDYLDVPESFYKYKVFIPKANGSGALGEILSTPLIGEPLIGATDTFLTIGSFEAEEEAEHCLKYVRSKFARVMLGVLKVTPDNTKEKWIYVPLQDFTSNSDIDWTRSIHDIDAQLYAKYGLDAEEKEFVETNVKEMSE